MLSFFHTAIVVDPVVLRELEALVARAITAQDGDALREFVASRKQAYAGLEDAEATWLDADAVAKVLAEIGKLPRSSHDDSPAGLRLLELARTTSTRPRYVSKYPYERLLRSAGRLARLVELKAPPRVVEADMSRALGCLESLDTFDYAVRALESEEAARIEDRDVVDACLWEGYVPGTERVPGYPNIGTRRENGALSRCFVKGRVLFPKPNGVEKLALWARFCGDFSTDTPPRVAVGRDIVHAMQGVMALNFAVGKDKALSVRKRQHVAEMLTDYAWCLKSAHEGGHSVVEWMDAAEADEDEEDEEDDEDQVEG
jgi:hypothetical protein